MAIQVRKGTGEVLPALVSSYNDMRAGVAVSDSKFHKGVTSTTSGDYTAKTSSPLQVTAADATDLASSIVLVNEIKLVYNLHCADALSHKVADTDNDVTTADALTTLAQVETLAIDLKAAYNTHIASTTYHYTADSTNAVAAADPSNNQTNTNTLLNEMKDDLNAHITGAVAGDVVELIDP